MRPGIGSAVSNHKGCCSYRPKGGCRLRRKESGAFNVVESRHPRVPEAQRAAAVLDSQPLDHKASPASSVYCEVYPFFPGYDSSRGECQSQGDGDSDKEIAISTEDADYVVVETPQSCYSGVSQDGDSTLLQPADSEELLPPKDGKRQRQELLSTQEGWFFLQQDAVSILGYEVYATRSVRSVRR